MTGAVQNVSVSTPTWNGISSVVTCDTSSNSVTLTVNDAEILGTLLYIRKTASGNSLIISANGNTSFATLANENDTVQLIWNGTDWVIIALSDLPASISATSLTTSGNVSVGGNISATGTLAVTGAATFANALNVTGTASFITGNFVLGATAVAQASSRTAGVTINAKAGVITTVSSSSGTTPNAFTVTNNFVTANSVVLLSVSGANAGPSVYRVSAVAAGSFNITYTMASDVTTATQFNFLVIN